MKAINNTHRRLRRSVGQSIHTHHMIEDGDRIVVGLSGGQDSMVLLWLLHERLRWIPIDYRLHPVHVDPGFDGGCGEAVADFCRGLGLVCRIEMTDFGLVAHSHENRENPCFLCSRRRRQRLFEVAEALDCTKIALGHHKDDFIETLFLNMCYAGKIDTMSPVEPFFNGRFEVIRPMAAVDKEAIARFTNRMGFPVLTNPCPSATCSRRGQIKTLLEALYASNANIGGNLFSAIQPLMSPAHPPGAASKRRP